MARRGEYRRRMELSYPIHPELFDRLFSDWSTLDKFQRTRGVLRLMALAISQLWQRGDQSLLIMPGNLPMDSGDARQRDEEVPRGGLGPGHQVRRRRRERAAAAHRHGEQALRSHLGHTACSADRVHGLSGRA